MDTRMFVVPDKYKKILEQPSSSSVGASLSPISSEELSIAKNQEEDLYGKGWVKRFSSKNKQGSWESYDVTAEQVGLGLMSAFALSTIALPAASLASLSMPQAILAYMGLGGAVGAGDVAINKYVLDADPTRDLGQALYEDLPLWVLGFGAGGAVQKASSAAKYSQELAQGMRQFEQASATPKTKLPTPPSMATNVTRSQVEAIDSLGRKAIQLSLAKGDDLIRTQLPKIVNISEKDASTVFREAGGIQAIIEPKKLDELTNSFYSMFEKYPATEWKTVGINILNKAFPGISKEITDVKGTQNLYEVVTNVMLKPGLVKQARSLPAVSPENAKIFAKFKDLSSDVIKNSIRNGLNTEIVELAATKNPNIVKYLVTGKSSVDPVLFRQKFLQGILGNTGKVKNINVLYEYMLGNPEAFLGKVAPQLQASVQAYHLDAIQAGKAKSILNSVLTKLSKSEFENFGDYVEGIKKPPNKSVERAVKVWSKVQKYVADKAIKSEVMVRTGVDKRGIPQFREFIPISEGYFPHQATQEFLDMAKPANREKFLQKMIKKGWATTKAEAEFQLENYVLGNVDSYFGNLNRSRKAGDLIKYNKSASTLFDYLDSAFKRIGESKRLGGKYEKMETILETVREIHGSDAANLAREAMNFYIDGTIRSLGIQKHVAKAVSAINQFNVMTLMSYSWIPNMSQMVNNALKADIASAIKAEMQWFRGSNATFVSKANLLLSRLAEDIGASSRFGTETGTLGKATKFVLRPFTQVEMHNVYTGTTTGKLYLEDLFKQFKANPADSKIQTLLREVLPTVNLDMLAKRGHLTTTEKLLGARKFEELTQFTGGLERTPLAMQTPIGRFLTLFKGIVYKQGLLVHSATVGEWKAGNKSKAIKNIVKLLTLYPAGGEVVADMSAALSGRERTDNMFLRYLENCSYLLGLGFTQDIIYFLANPSKSRIYSYATNPIVTLIGDTVYGLGKTLQGDIRPLTKTIVGRIPFLGKPLSSALREE